MPTENDTAVREATTHVRVSDSTHTALKRARRGDMTFDDVIADALRDYEPYNPDPAVVLDDDV